MLLLSRQRSRYHRSSFVYFLRYGCLFRKNEFLNTLSSCFNFQTFKIFSLASKRGQTVFSITSFILSDYFRTVCKDDLGCFHIQSMIKILKFIVYLIYRSGEPQLSEVASFQEYIVNSLNYLSWLY